MIPSIERFYRVLYLLPTVLHVVTTVEDLATDRPGIEKRNMALAGVQAITDSLHQFGIVDKDQQGELEQTAVGLIDAVVHAQNTLGLFQHRKSEEEKKAQEAAGPDLTTDYDARYKQLSAEEQGQARRRAAVPRVRPTPASEVLRQAETETQEKVQAAGWPGRQEQVQEPEPQKTA